MAAGAKLDARIDGHAQSAKASNNAQRPMQSHAGKPRQICVPKHWQQRVRQAVNDYQELQRLIEEISELEWERLKERKP